MRISFLLVLMFILADSSQSQNVTARWGPPFKLQKNAYDLSLLNADPSGIYLTQKALALKAYYVVGASTRNTANLMKLDKNFQEVYVESYSKELKGKEFGQFFALKDQLFIISYINKNKNIEIYGAQIEKKTGQFIGDWVLISEFSKATKNDKITLSTTPNADSSALILSARIENAAKKQYAIVEVRNDLKSSGKKTILSNDITPALYELEDFIYTAQNRIILVGRVLEYAKGKKQTNKNREFSHYHIQMFNDSGKLIKQFNTSVEGKWLITSSVFQQDNKLILAAFYSNQEKGKITDGLLVQTIDPYSGEILSTVKKDISPNLLEPAVDKKSLANESSQEKKERENFEKIKNTSEGFSNLTKFRKIYFTDQGEMIIVAERFSSHTYASTRTSGSGPTARSYDVVTTAYETGNFVFCKIVPEKGIEWIKVVPKIQRESNTYEFSGFTSFQQENKLNIIFNDNPYNSKVVQPGQNIAAVNMFNNTTCFMLTLNMENGEITRKQLFSNTNQPVILLQSTLLMNETMYILGHKFRLMGRPELSVGKLNIK